MSTDTRTELQCGSERDPIVLWHLYQYMPSIFSAKPIPRILLETHGAVLPFVPDDRSTSTAQELLGALPLDGGELGAFACPRAGSEFLGASLPGFA